MKKVSLSGSLREDVGKKSTKKLRREERVPCVVYGKGEQIHFSVSDKELGKLVWSPDVCNFILDIDGKEYSTILQDIQFHPVTDITLHVDFFALSEDKEFIVSLPIETTGTAVGVAKGGKLFVNRRKLKVKGLLSDMPETIKIDISKLNVNNSINVAQLNADSKLLFMDPMGSAVVSVISARAAAAMSVEEEESEEESEEGSEEGAEE
ncbi:MAG: 50S ribosomal protein L25 [Bacteroidota bacterium]|nr:50S ribosomal protein L25 [Bacteroidota bacterium]